ncbi:Uncharacterised protein [Mycobacteroides abscessus subsp. abscessus]|nr:Uncharacterised protein [Mycobacteroides abscessus subsp. abscessus]
MRHGLDINSLQLIRADDTDSFAFLDESDTHFLHFGNQGCHMFRNCILYQHVSACDSSCYHKGSCLDAVRDDVMDCSEKHVYAFDFDRSCACAFYFCPHFIEEVSEVDNLRLFCNVLDDGCALCKGCSHHDIFSCPDTREVQIYFCSLQAVFYFRFNEAISYFYLSTHGFKAFKVLIDRT